MSDRKWGAGSLAAFARLGLKELRNAINPSRDSIADVEIGMYGTQTQGEIAQARAGPGLGPEEESPQKTTLDEMRQETADKSRASERDRGRDKGAGRKILPWKDDAGATHGTDKPGRPHKIRVQYFSFWSPHMNPFTSLRHMLLVSLGATAGMALWLWVSSGTVTKAPPLDPVRMRAWDKVSSRLRAQQNSSDPAELQLQRIRDFFADKQQRTRDFADDVLGWSGKWHFVKGKIFRDDGKAHQLFMRQAFERHFFTAGDLQGLMQSVVAAHLSELEGQENALLVAIRADLSEQDLPALRELSAMKSDENFQREYRRLLDQVVPIVSRDMKVTIGREAVVWVASDIAAAVTVRIASAVAVRLGVSGGILGTGAASGVATLGVGVAVGFVVDGAADWIMRQAGYDPSGEIAGKVSVTLTGIEKMLLDGDPEARSVYQKLLRLQDSDPVFFVRDECRRAANSINAGGALGLRHELNRLRQLRTRLCEAALKKLVLEGGAS